MSFYVILFVALMAVSLTHPLNPADTPLLQAGLRQIVLPISLVLGAGVFILSLVQIGRRNRISAKSEKDSNKAAA